MTPTDRLAAVCRRAQSICNEYGPQLTCEAFDAGDFRRYAGLYPNDPPCEGRVGLTITAPLHRVIDLEGLVAELERLDHVWRVFLTFERINSLS